MYFIVKSKLRAYIYWKFDRFSDLMNIGCRVVFWCSFRILLLTIIECYKSNAKKAIALAKTVKG